VAYFGSLVMYRTVHREEAAQRWSMTTYQPATPHSDSIVRPACSKCGTATRLFGIYADAPGLELLPSSAPPAARLIRSLGR
jgi:hypothetical protein